ncbi:WW domain-binding protein 11 [Lingula anatina]|uniref:WW domain-binding protein 11 n=1 Tax=Lingula anatina TaxID=7574 RepID=A0A1S3HBR1_LINAN|nr:WW domain-binding protein 11 [Lingula anatina]|eukprot:XP_013382961.1 WW domain-binding protein 11 [Lingula anatina]
MGNVVGIVAGLFATAVVIVFVVIIVRSVVRCMKSGPERGGTTVHVIRPATPAPVPVATIITQTSTTTSTACIQPPMHAAPGGYVGPGIAPPGMIQRPPPGHPPSAWSSGPGFRGPQPGSFYGGPPHHQPPPPPPPPYTAGHQRHPYSPPTVPPFQSGAFSGYPPPCSQMY